MSTRTLAMALTAAALLSILPSRAVAQTNPYTWNLTASGNWNTAADWLNGNNTAEVPPSGATTQIIFAGSTTYTATDNIAGAFSLNSLTISNTGTTTIAASTGDSLSFGGTAPGLTVSAGAGAATISAAIAYATATTITNNSSNLLTLSGAQTLTATPTFAGSGSIKISGAIGAGSLIMSGGGTLTLSSTSNVFTSLTINSGTVAFGATTTAGASGNAFNVNGGTLSFPAAFTASSTTHFFNFTAPATVNVASGITASFLGNLLSGSAGTLNKIGAGIISIGSSGTSTVGTLNIMDGTVQETSNRIGSVGTLNVTGTGQFRVDDDGTGTFPIASGGIISLAGIGPAGSTTPGAVALIDQSGTSTTPGGPISTLSNAIHLTANVSAGVFNGSSSVRFSTLVFSGIVSGTGSLTKLGNGALVLSNADTYGGSNGTTTVANGILQISGAANRLPTTTTLILGDATANTSGIFDLNGLAQTVGNLAIAGTGTANAIISSVANGTLTANIATPTTFAGQLGGGSSGNTLNFMKAGSASLTLTATNTYTGSTTVSSGSLVIGSAGALPATSGSVTVAPGAVLDFTALSSDYVFASNQTLTAGRSIPLAAGNDILGNVTIGGTLSLGASAPTAARTVAFANNLTLNGAVAVQFFLSNTTGGNNDSVVVGGNLNLLGTSNLYINAPSGLPTGSYSLISYAGNLTGNAANLTLTGTPPAGTSRQGFALDTTTTPGSVQLIVTGGPANLTWVGDSTGANNVWDLVTTANFTGATGPTPDNRFYNGDNVTFDATGAGGGANPVTINGTLNPGSIIVTGNQDYIFSGSGSIAGSGSLTKSGSGTLTLSTANTYTGGTIIQSGGFVLTGSIVGPLTINGGTVSIVSVNPSITSTTISAGSLTIVPNGTMGGSIAISGGSVTLTGANGATAGNIAMTGGTLNFDSQLDMGAAATIAVSGGGALNILGNYSSTGDTQVWTVGSGGATIAVAQGFVASKLGSQLIGPGNTVTLTGPGTLTVGSSGTSTVGTYLVNAGTLRFTSQRLASVTAITVASGASLYNLDTTSFTLTSQFSINGTVTLSGDGANIPGVTGTPYLGTTNGSGAYVHTLDEAGSANSGFNSPIVLAGTSRFTLTALGRNSGADTVTETFNQIISGPGGLIKDGEGTMILAVANSYAGNTTISNGTIKLGTSNGLPAGTALQLGEAGAANSGVLDLGGFSQTVTGLATSGTGASNSVINSTGTDGALIVNYAGPGQTFAGQLGVTGSTNFGVTKTGAGTLTLTGVNGFNRVLTIASGTLALSGSGSISNAPAITINSGATLDVTALAGGFAIGTASSQTLQGTGSVAGAVTVAALGTIRGDSGAGTGVLTLNGNATVSSGTLATSLASAGGSITANSQIALGSSTLNLDSTAGKFNILLLNDAGLTAGQSYSLTLATGASPASFLRNGTPWDATNNPFTATDFNVVSGSGAFTFSNASLTVLNNNDLTISFSPVAATPEPVSILLMSTGFLAALGGLRRVNRC